MKHSVSTQKGSYDLDANIRLTEQAFTWAEAYAQKHDLQAPMEQDQEYDDDGIPSFDAPAATEFSPAEKENDCVHTVTSAPTRGDIADLLRDSPPRSPPRSPTPVVHAQPATKRKSATAAPAAMASLPNMRCEVAKKKKQKYTPTPTPNASTTLQQPLYGIDRIIGGSRVEAEGTASHRVSVTAMKPKRTAKPAGKKHKANC